MTGGFSSENYIEINNEIEGNQNLVVGVAIGVVAVMVSESFN